MRAVITKLNSNKAHRAIILEGKQPVAVVALSDIFRYLAQASWEPKSPPHDTQSKRRSVNAEVHHARSLFLGIPVKVDVQEMELERKHLEKVALAAIDSCDSPSRERDDEVSSQAEPDLKSPLNTYHPSKIKFLREKLTSVWPKKKTSEIIRINTTSSVKEAAKVSIFLQNLFFRSSSSFDLDFV